MIRVLFVCTGNICRSPSAQGVFEKLAQIHGLGSHITVDSAGTHAYHVGEAPDSRAQLAALKRDIDISRQRARQVCKNDFKEFDHILAMDEDNYWALDTLCPREEKHKIKMLLSFAPELAQSEVPDPYYGGAHGFDHVLDLLESACQKFLEHVCAKHQIKVSKPKSGIS
jgi:protein-tyrosine phosphatase